MYLGISLTAAGTGLILPVIAYLGASVSPQKLGVTMGGLAAAAGVGQTLGSSAGGWLFGAVGQLNFAWLVVPLAIIMMLLPIRPRGWLGHSRQIRHVIRPGGFPYSPPTLFKDSPMNPLQTPEPARAATGIPPRRAAARPPAERPGRCRHV